MQEKIREIVREAIDEMNEDLEDAEQIIYAEESNLFGKGGVDSFSFVTLISNIEDRILDEFNKEIYLVKDTALTGKENPFATVGSLEKYIETVLEEES